MSTAVSDQITRKSASNLALAFILLPPRKRAAMSALYAFCREVDDIADEPGRTPEARRQELTRWRVDVRRACDGGGASLPVVRELQPFIAEFRLPYRLFDELIQGVEMDLEVDAYETQADLERYCYHVASVVGLLSIEIFGYRDPRIRVYADALGKALQLTNILRDVGGDARRGRVYLPTAELKRYGVTREEVLERRDSDRFRRLAAAMSDRARHWYRLARENLPTSERRSMVAAELMGAVYWQLLRRLEKDGFPVLQPEPVRLGKLEKRRLILLAWLRVKTGLPVARYGI